MLAYVSVARFDGKWHFTLQHVFDSQFNILPKRVSYVAPGLQTSLMQCVHPC